MPARPFVKLVFAGTPDFAATALGALIAAGHDIVLVLTQPDRPSGRGLQVRPTPVKALAVAHGIEVLQPLGLRLGGRHDAAAGTAQDRLAATPHDAMVVAAYGLILPAPVLAIPPLGCINIHASLLPRWRGAAPIQRAIEAGDAATGVTIMQMDEGLDTGEMLLVRSIAIADDDTAATLTDRLAVLGGEAIVDALAALGRGALPSRPQHAPGDAAAVTYAAKLHKAESPLDFTIAARRLVDRVRAFDPWPGCSATLVDRASGAASPYKVWRARTLPPPLAATFDAAGSPGRVVGFVGSSAGAAFPTGAVVVATADGLVALTELQKPGGRRSGAGHFAGDFGGSGDRFFEAPSSSTPRDDPPA